MTGQLSAERLRRRLGGELAKKPGSADLKSAPDRDNGQQGITYSSLDGQSNESYNRDPDATSLSRDPEKCQSQANVAEESLSAFLKIQAFEGEGTCMASEVRVSTEDGVRFEKQVFPAFGIRVRQEYQSRQKDFMEKHIPGSDALKTRENPPTYFPPSLLKKEVNKALNETSEKDDDWGANDIFMMLPDGSDSFIGNESKERHSHKVNANKSVNLEEIPTTAVCTTKSTEFGGVYEPSFLTPRRSPLAGRRRSPVTKVCVAQPTEDKDHAVKTSFIRLSSKADTADLNCPSDEVLPSIEGILEVGRLTTGSDGKEAETRSTHSGIQGATNILDAEKSNWTVPTHDTLLRRDTEPDLNKFEGSKEHGSKLEKKGERSMDVFKDITAQRTSEHQREQLCQKSADFPVPGSLRKVEEEWNGRQSAFCDLLLAERNALQLKLDLEREKFSQERELFQAKLYDDGLRLQGEIQVLSTTKDKLTTERDNLGTELDILQKDNVQLKNEVLRVESERLAFERKLCDADQSSEDILLNKLEQEKDEAKGLAMMLTSEVQLLKNSFFLAEEKIACMNKLHEEELDMMKTLHIQELDVKEKQLEMERKFWSDHKITQDTVTKLLNKGDEWAVKVAELHSIFQLERNEVSNDKTAWLGVMNETIHKAEAVLLEWGQHCRGIRNQFDQLMEVLESGRREIKTMHDEERERLDKEHGDLKLLQEALQEERAHSLADLSTSRDRLEEMRSQCFLEKESFIASCMQELNNIALEKEVVAQMREQLLQAEATLEKHILEHTIAMQAETSEAAKQHTELERAKEMASEILREVEVARRDLDQQREAFEKEISCAREFGLQAQQKVESALGIQRQALQLKIDAEALKQECALEACELERQRAQIELAQKELLELKRRHDEERMRLAVERQEWCSEHQKETVSYVVRDSGPKPGAVYSVYENGRTQVLDFGRWENLQRLNQTNVVSPRSSQFAGKSRKATTPGSWVVESVEASLCLQAQEDFLAEASKVLQHTTQSTCRLLTKS